MGSCGTKTQREQSNSSLRLVMSTWNVFVAHPSCCINEQLIPIGHSLWYSTDYDEGEQGMVEYCTLRNQVKQIIKYPANIELDMHSLCESNGLIYIIDGMKQQIILFNPKTKHFIQTTQIFCKIGRYPCCTVINNNIHILNGSENRKHLIYSIENNTIQVFNDVIATADMTVVSILKYNKRIIRLGGSNCDEHRFMDLFAMSAPIEPNKFTNIKWLQKAQNKLPKTMYGFGSVLYKHYIIIFGGRTKNDNFFDSIYLLDLNTNNGWLKLNHISCPLKSMYRATMDSNSDIHLFTAANHANYRKSTRRHYSIPVSNVLRMEYRKQLQLLSIWNFLQKYTNSVPLEIKHLCFAFVGSFVDFEPIKSRVKVTIDNLPLSVSTEEIKLFIAQKSKLQISVMNAVNAGNGTCAVELKMGKDITIENVMEFIRAWQTSISIRLLNESKDENDSDIECTLKVTNFDIVNYNIFEDFTKLFSRFESLNRNIGIDLDGEGEPFAIVSFGAIDDAISCRNSRIQFKGRTLQMRYMFV